MELIRVTEALKLAGKIPDMPYATEYHLERGRAVHRAIELDARGRLDAATVHPDVAPYLASWIQWRAASRAVYERGEFEVRNDSRGYVGHPDAIIAVGATRYLVDFKCGPPADWHRLQTALYVAALGDLKLRRGGIYLRKDGSIASFVPHVSARDFLEGFAAVKIALDKRPLTAK